MRIGHVVLTAPRRTGKNSVLDHLRDHPQNGFQVVSINVQPLAAMPTMHGGLNPGEPMLEFKTTHDPFRDELLSEQLDIRGQVEAEPRQCDPARSSRN
ncbi:MAG: hypothetical protein F4Y60_03545 [Boseongicola sp. SB0664_bin_43]|uniref:Uncharacterized protein n=1 Tax=Boseongicola sp. SB0664_bin_43 TaxID=2604844 RepID=A0A6B0XZT4_9RHOB|nr:hypothetical protein [Boseongicola sp. SB0664_bin_43]MYK32488.1 hypothetical protein [Boseongicola sp. SB0670_bin_30]